MRSPGTGPPTGDHVDLPGYLLAELTPEQERAVDAHLAGCDGCRDEVVALREWTDALRDVPGAMLLDGPPEDADLLLQRTLRQVRAEGDTRRRRRLAVAGSAAAVVLVAAVSGGIAVGRSTAPDGPPLAAPVSSATAAAGTIVAAATDRDTGARISLSMLPAAGWVRITATVGGIPAGERCRLEVVGRDGTAVPAGSWLVPAEGAAHAVTLSGSAAVAADRIAAVRVVNEAGRQFAAVTM